MKKFIIILFISFLSLKAYAETIKVGVLHSLSGSLGNFGDNLKRYNAVHD